MRAVAAQTEGADTMPMGRRTYRGWTAYWPHQGDDVPVASPINGTSKLVASTTLTTVDWLNCRLIDAEHDLLDELNLLVSPGTVARNTGRRSVSVRAWWL